MSVSDPLIAVTVEHGVATLCFDRPANGNALSLALVRELADTVATLDHDEAVRCVLLTGSGRFFCVGGDIGAFREAGDSVPVLLKQITAAMHAAVARLARMSKPLVVAVNGPAAGAGLGFAALGDIVLAARSAHFTMAYTGIGLTPDAGTTALLPRLIGLRRTQELALTNRRVSAEEAASIGLVTRVVDDAALMDEAREVARTLAAGPVLAHGAIRRLLLAWQPLETQMELEAQEISLAAAGLEGREGISAFLAKRKPTFVEAGPAL